MNDKMHWFDKIMCRKLTIIMLVLLIAGTVGFGWVLLEQRTEKKLQQQRQEKAKAYKENLDKLLAGETKVYLLPDAVLDEAAEWEFDSYRARKERVEMVTTLSIVCVSTGGGIFALWLLRQTVRLLVKVLSKLCRFMADLFEALWYLTKNKLTNNVEQRQTEETVTQNQHFYFQADTGARQQTACSHRAVYTQNESDKNSVSQSADPTAVLLCDEDSVKYEEQLKAGGVQFHTYGFRLDEAGENPADTALPDTQEDSIEVQTENLQKQVDEFAQMAQQVRENAAENSAPIDNTLKELTQEVAAIREYASEQQDRVKKLQDGYDWNIIRTFCLRIIRCIDNLGCRIERQAKNNIETTELEEIRDEMIFALESSGVEQFKPEINSDYRGQEKFAEAVKQKKSSNKKNMSGKIAEVIRPGYRYAIDEDNIKIVRTAQVKLYR